MKNIISKVINNYINDVINESKGLLTERASSVVYHWASPSTARAILETNRFSLMNNLFKRAESNLVGTSHNRMWYMSLTRNGKIGMGGYSNSDHPWVRFTLDSDKLNSNFHTKAIDYWGALMGKNSRYDNQRFKVNGHIELPRTETESEDRLYSRKPFIENAITYIKAIDIYLNINKYEDMKDKPYGGIISPKSIEDIYTVFLKFNKKGCNIYTTVEDFNLHKNPVSADFFYEWYRKQTVTKNLDYPSYDKNVLPTDFLASIVYVVNFLDGTLNKCILTLKKYGLERYASKVVKYLQNPPGWGNIYWFGDKSILDPDSIKRTILEHFENIELGNNAQSLNRDELSKAYQILSDFCNRNKVKTKYDIINYFINNLNKGKINDDIKYDEPFDLICTKLPYETRVYVCVNPSITKYADIFGKNILENLYNDLEYYVDNHRSKSDKFFKSYIKRLLLKGSPTIQDIITLYNNLKSLGNERLELDYKPELFTKQVPYNEIYYVLKYPDYEYGNHISTNDGGSLKIKSKEQYEQLKNLIDNYGK